MRKIKENRIYSLIIITIGYIFGSIVGMLIFDNLNFDLWINILIADIIGTFIIYIFSLIFSNATFYDPYWSVQPIIITLALIIYFQIYTATTIILLILILIWGLRLTINWIKTFSNLYHQDWRYDMLKEKSKKFYFLVNLFGIQLFPTLIVFFCILPIIKAIETNLAFNWLMIIGILISLIAISLEALADIQMHRFQKIRKSRSEIIRIGLWKNSRHPNYLGEIMMWYGIYLIVLAGDLNLWYVGLGALINTLLFLFISIPLTEKRMIKYKDNFLDYKKETRMLLPFKR